MEYISFSNNPKEQTHLKDIDHELKTHGFTYKKDKIDVSYVRYQEGETVPPVYMISKSDVSKYFHVKLSGLKMMRLSISRERMTAISKTKRRIS